MSTTLLIDKITGYIHGATSGSAESDIYDCIQIELPSYEYKEGYIYKDGSIVKIEIPKPSRFHKWTGSTWESIIPISTYIDNRINSYPPIAEQLDMLYHAMDKGEIPIATEWYNAIKTIKQNNPKE